MNRTDKLIHKITKVIERIENTKEKDEGIGIVIREKVSDSLKVLGKYDIAAEETLSKRYIQACRDNSKKPSGLLKEINRLKKEGKIRINGKDYIDLNK